MSHSCNWPGCFIQISDSTWACSDHWLRLPPELRIELWQAYGNPYKFSQVSLAVKAWVHERNQEKPNAMPLQNKDEMPGNED